MKTLLDNKKIKKMEHEGDGDTNCGWSTWNNPRILVKGLEEWETRKQVETIPTTVSLRSARILRRVQET